MSKLAGKWATAVKLPIGNVESEAEFFVDGNKLTGTILDLSNGHVSEIRKGKVDGDSFSLEITFITLVGDMETKMTGCVNVDDMLVGVSENPMGEFDFEARRL